MLFSCLSVIYLIACPSVCTLCNLMMLLLRKYLNLAEVQAALHVKEDNGTAGVPIYWESCKYAVVYLANKPY